MLNAPPTIESADCVFLRAAFMSSDFIDPIIYFFNLLIKIKFLSLDSDYPEKKESIISK
jgi:hypothetical protein